MLYGKRELLEAMPPFLTGGDMIRKVDYEHTTFNELPVEVRSRHEQHRRCHRASAPRATTSPRSAWTGCARTNAHLLGYALERLAPLESRGLAIYGPRDPATAAGVISFNFADIHAHDLASILDTEGVCIRAGHHCTMPLMEKMGWPATARASFYLYNRSRHRRAR